MVLLLNDIDTTTMFEGKENREISSSLRLAMILGSGKSKYLMKANAC
jgi:hypothetical protein